MKRVIKSSTLEYVERINYDGGYSSVIDYDKDLDQYRYTLYDPDKRIVNGGICNSLERAEDSSNRLYNRIAD